MKFDMGAQTLANLGKQTQGASDDLGSLIKRLVDAAQPLEPVFKGPAKRKFDTFKQDADQVAKDLDTALGRILGGVRGMDTEFGQGVQDMATQVQGAQQQANFDQARFR